MNALFFLLWLPLICLAAYLIMIRVRRAFFSIAIATGAISGGALMTMALVANGLTILDDKWGSTALFVDVMYCLTAAFIAVPVAKLRLI